MFSCTDIREYVTNFLHSFLNDKMTNSIRYDSNFLEVSPISLDVSIVL